MLNKKGMPTLLITALVSTLAFSALANPLVTSPIQTEEVANLIPMESFFNEEQISNIKLSPNGKWIAFYKNVNGVKNIHLVKHNEKLSTSFAITQSKETITDFFWAASGNKIFYSYDKGGNENTQISYLTFNNTNTPQSIKVKTLTNNPEVKYVLLKQVKNTPDQLLVMSNHDNANQMDVFQLNYQSKKLSNIVNNNLGFNNVEFDNNGMPTVAISSNIDNTQSLYITSKNKWHSVFTSKKGEKLNLLRYDESRNILFLTADIEGRDKQELISFSLETKSFKTIHTDPEKESDVYDVKFNENNQPISVSYYGSRLRTYPLNKEFAKHWKNINQLLGNNVEISIKSINKETHQWQLKVGSDVTLDKDYRYDAKTNELVPLLPQEPMIDPKDLSKRQSITYQARDGLTIQAYLTLPKYKQKNLPTIILPHGGPWTRDYWTLSSGYFPAIAQLLANRGYAVLQPNFRSSTGFGKKFINLGNKNWGTGSMQHDLTDGVNYLINQGISDKTRIGIMGASYGGYAALAGITFTPDLFQAAISYVGPSSLITLVEAFPSYLRPYLGQFFTSVGDPLIESDRKDMNARSPINFVERIKTPLLLIQGANDPRVTQAESDNIAKVMAKKGIPVEYVLAKDEGHGFKKQKNQLAFIIAMEKFFAKNLGGRMDKTPSEEIEKHLNTLRVNIEAL